LRVDEPRKNDGKVVDNARVQALAREVERLTFADIGGLEEVKQEIRRRIILPFEKPSMFRRFRKRIGGGILVYGPPGCGKTLLARATAGECGANSSMWRLPMCSLCGSPNPSTTSRPFSTRRAPARRQYFSLTS
jgi:SpoVK/Ycf46/Vps4 family AAA+-type ATPase